MDELKLDDVYDVWYTSFWQTSVGYGILLGLLACGVLFLYAVGMFIQRYRRGSTRERALRALKALASKVEHNRIDARKVYQELTDTIKSYAQWRYDMPRGATDYELTVWLAHAGCKKDQCDDIVRVVVDAQAVKFGRVETLKKQVQSDIDVSISFIETTGKQKE